MNSTKTKRQSRSAAVEPIAIIGMGCRFPGASNLEEFWSLLKRGSNTTREVPQERWDLDATYSENIELPGKTYTRFGSFISGHDHFEPRFFNISVREAESMDPQQRIVMLVAWQALENAGIIPSKIEKSSTGVFIGMSTDDFAELNITDPAGIDMHKTLGGARSIVAGRLSHFFNFSGPSIQVDTACSSSLVSVQQACVNLQAGECSLALAGGINLMLTPNKTISLCKLKALSKDGLCKTFDASADGYGRGEGCGIIVLKRLSDALRDNDRIWGVIKGISINHDGRSNGLTAPNGLAQESLMRNALKNAGIHAADVQYIEAHGTGTVLGDPIEVQAINKVYGGQRADANPLFIGSVKTNIGHLEAAAGVAGLIKVVLSLSNRQLPPHLHLKKPNPHIPWQRMAIKVPSHLIDWPKVSKKHARAAGVSSFGLSGTNVHLVVEEAPAQVVHVYPTKFNDPEIFTLSAKTPRSLLDLCSAYSDYLLSDDKASLADICFSTNIGRSAFRYRVVAVEASRAALANVLSNMREEDLKDVKALQGELSRPKICLVFTGGPMPAFARELYTRCEVFANKVDDCAAYLLPLLRVDIRSAFTITAVEFNYPESVAFTFEYAFGELLKLLGVEPHAVLASHRGKLAAACFSGIFSVGECLKITALLDEPVSGKRDSIGHPNTDNLKQAFSNIQLRTSLIPFFDNDENHNGGILTSEDWISYLTSTARSHPDKNATRNPALTWLYLHSATLSHEKSNPIADCVASPRATVLRLLKELYLIGHDIEWRTFFGVSSHRRVELPHYRFNESKIALKRPQASNLKQSDNAYQYLLGQRTRLAHSDETLFDSHLNEKDLLFAHGKAVATGKILSAYAYIGIFLTAPKQTVWKANWVVCRDLDIAIPVHFHSSSQTNLQILVKSVTNDSVHCALYFREDPDGRGTLSASATVCRLNTFPQANELHKVRNLFAGATVMERLTSSASNWDGANRWIFKEGWNKGGELLARFRTSQKAPTKTSDSNYYVLNGCFSLFELLIDETGNNYEVSYVGECGVVDEIPIEELWIYITENNSEELRDNTRSFDCHVFNEKCEIAFLRNVKVVSKNPVRSLQGSVYYKKIWVHDELGVSKQSVPPQYSEAVNILNRLSAAYAIESLYRLGWRRDKFQGRTIVDVADSLGVQQKYHRLLKRLGEIADDEINKGYKIDLSINELRAEYLLTVPNDHILARYAQPELQLLLAAAPHIHEVLTGTKDALSLLFPRGRHDLVTRLYQESTTGRLGNALIANCIIEVVNTHHHRKSPVRILEIGAGTGSTAAYLLPMLAAYGVKYTFTDISQKFLNEAREKFAQFDFVDYRLFNLEHDIISQGFSSNSFDVIVAANVFHATTNLRNCLVKSSDLLSPCGYLLVLEGTAKNNWLDVIFGLTDGWWNFTDHVVRQEYPLISKERWQELLRETGFELSQSQSSKDESGEQLSDQTLFVGIRGVTASDSQKQKNRWLVLADSADDLGNQLVERLASKGKQCFLIRRHRNCDQTGFLSSIRMNKKAFEEDLEVLSEQLKGEPTEGIIYLSPLGETDIEPKDNEHIHYSNGRFLREMKQSTDLMRVVSFLYEKRLMPRLGLSIITRNANWFNSSDPVYPLQAIYTGLAKVITYDLPELKCVSIDLGASKKSDGAHVLAELFRGHGTEVAYRNGQRFSPRLQQFTLSGPDLKMDTNATYLITGGGKLGMSTARLLIEMGARFLIMLKRSEWDNDGLPNDISQAIQRGVKIHFAKIDVANVSEMQNLFEQIDLSWPPLKGVIHTAAQAAFSASHTFDEEAFEVTMSAKVNGSLLLHWHTSRRNIDFLIFYSSTTSIVGARGLAYYTAANRFLDALAAHRRNNHLPCLSVNWGPWSEGMMSENTVTDAKRVGMIPFTDPAIRLISPLGNVDVPNVSVVKLDRPVFEKYYGFLFSGSDTGYTTSLTQQLETPSVREGSLKNTILAEDSFERKTSMIVQYLKEQVSKALKMQVNDIDASASLLGMGTDSLIAIELKNTILADLSISLDVINFINGSNICQIAVEMAKANGLKSIP